MQKKMYKRKSLVHFAKPHHLETKYRASKENLLEHGYQLDKVFHL